MSDEEEEGATVSTTGPPSTGLKGTFPVTSQGRTPQSEINRDDKACYLGDHVWVRKNPHQDDAGYFCISLGDSSEPSLTGEDMTLIAWSPSMMDGLEEWLDRRRNDPEELEKKRMAYAEAQADAAKDAAATDVPRGTLDMS